MNMITTILEPFTPLQGISRKVASWNFLEYFRVWWAFVNKILRGCCTTISWSIYRFWSTYLNIRENCITWTVRTSSILTIQFSLSRNSQTVFWNKLITSIWHHKLNITVSNFYVMITFYVQNVHRSPIHKSLVDGQSFTACSDINGFLEHGRPDQMQCVFQLGESFWLWLQLIIRLQRCLPQTW